MNVPGCALLIITTQGHFLSTFSTSQEGQQMVRAPPSAVHIRSVPDYHINKEGLDTLMVNAVVYIIAAIPNMPRTISPIFSVRVLATAL
jgi:hypothetical protein